MKLQIFSIHDKVADAFLPPFFLPTIPQAQRAIGDAFADPQHQFYLHPDHYTLHHLGEFCDITGRIDRFENTRIIPVDKTGQFDIDGNDEIPNLLREQGA